MSSNAQVKEASVFGPTASLTGTTYQASGIVTMGGLRGVMRVATSTTNVQETLPVVNVPGSQGDVRPYVPLQGKWLRLKNESAASSLEFAFGVTAAPTLVYGQAATMASGHASAGWRLAPLEWIDVLVPVDARFMAHIQETGAAASTLAMYCSEGQLGTK